MSSYHQAAQLSPAGSLEDFSSLSGYFISRISQTDSQQFDFTAEQILYLCDIEPQHCSTLINTLESGLGRDPTFLYPEVALLE